MTSPDIVYGRISVDFRLSSGKKADATFKYKYFSKDDSIEYMDIEYNNPQLQELVEGNEQMMEMIDRYIRNKLAQQNR